jgi:hypothetical protein
MTTDATPSPLLRMTQETPTDWWNDSCDVDDLAFAMLPSEFDAYGATARTLRAFIGSYHDLLATVRDIVLPNPDLRAG